MMAEARSIRGALARHAHHWLLLASLLLTFLGARTLQRMAEERDTSTFRNWVQATQDRIRKRFDTHLALLLATRSFFEARSSGELAEFRRYVQGLELERRYPGIQGIGFSQRFSREQKPDVEREMRRQGHASFRAWPADDRPEYHAIVFLEPLDRRNEAAIGFDMFSEPKRRAAMARARDSGAPAASQRVTLVQEIDTEKQPGFLIYVPVYREPQPKTLEARRESLIGFVYSPFRVVDLLSGLFAASETPRVSFQVFDGADPEPRARLYASRTGAFRGEGARFGTIERLEVAGRTWTLAYESTPALEAVSSSRFVPAFALLGVLASLLLFYVTRAQVRARAEAERSEAQARTARADAEAQRNNLHALFTQAPAAIAILRGHELRYELSNPMNDELMGRGGLVGKTFQEAVPEVAAQGFQQLAERVLESGEPVAGHEVGGVVRTPDGIERQKFVNFTYQPLRGPDGRAEGVVGFAYDVTEQVLARQKVEALAEDLKKAVRVRDDFVSVAGHELKTPLATLMLHVQALQHQVEKGSFGPPHPRLAERLVKAHRHVERLERLIEELLDVARVSSGHMTLQVERVDLVELLKDVIERFDEQLAHAQCEIRACLPEQLFGRWDRLRIDQVLTNLISNAVKYGAGKPIEVSVDEDEGVARVTVRDQGIGIAPQDRERVFARFERAVSDRHYGGLGLGLWISDQIAQAHGGRILLESSEGCGSAFTVELPRENEDVAAERASTSFPRHLAS